MERKFNKHEPEAVKESSDRTFGFVFAVFFVVVALAPVLRHHPMRPWALVMAGLLLAVALVHPAVLRPLKRAWLKLGELLHAVTNPIILAALFYLVFTPFAIVLRLLGKDFLRLRRNPGATTYWLPRSPPGPPPESMKHQF